MRRSTVFSLLDLFVLIPATLFLGMQLSGRSYYLTGTLIILELMIPFFVRFETRKPQARELVTIAVMAALAAVSRVAFAFLPNFKPLVAIVMLTGIAFGPEAGFLTGALSAFASNFAFAQGPWTPWQMMAYGMGGFLAGLFLNRRKIHILLLSAFGFVITVAVVGVLLDLCTVFTTGSTITGKYILTVFSLGLPFNLMHGLSSAVTVLLCGKPLLAKLDRLKTKYGMLA